MIAEPNIDKLKIPFDTVSFLGSGLSVNRLTEADFENIKNNTFVIGTNYIFLKYIPHLLGWGDPIIAEYVRNYYGNSPRPFLSASRKEAYKSKSGKTIFDTYVDYWYSKKHDKFFGNCTIFSLFQIITRNFPEKRVLLFGHDYHTKYHNTNVKVYDLYTPDDKAKKSRALYVKKTLPKFKEHMELWYNRNKERANNIFNCSPDSELKCFQKKDWKNLI